MNAELRRTLSLRDLIFIVVGTVIGSGIFLTPGGVVRAAGSGGVALVVWTIGGVLPLLAFLYGWTMFLVIGSGSMATLAAAFPRYVGVFVPLSAAASNAVSVAMIAVVTAVNVRGTRQSADVQGVATVVKGGVIMVLALLLVAMSRRSVQSDDWWPQHFSIAEVSGAITGMIGVLGA